MEAKDIKPGVKVRRVKHTPTTIHGCPIGFETEIIRPKENGIGFWYKDEYGDSSTTAHPQDWELVQAAGPVRTVTRREIVRGQYADVDVGEQLEIPDCDNPDVSPVRKVAVAYAGFRSSAELKAAAAVLLELAGALDNGE